MKKILVRRTKAKGRDLASLSVLLVWLGVQRRVGDALQGLKRQPFDYVANGKAVGSDVEDGEID